MDKTEGQEKIGKDKRRTFMYTIAKVIAWVMFHTIYPVTVHNKEYFQVNGPCILIANHLSGLDPICIAHAVKGQEITFLAKKELLQGRFLGWLLRKLHAIPVDRHNFDMAAMRACTQALRDKRILGIFPEGSRYKKGNMEEMEAGVAILALRNRAPVVPAYIHGKLRPFHRVHLYADAPVPMDDLLEMGVTKEASDTLLLRIAALYARLEKKAGA